MSKTFLSDEEFAALLGDAKLPERHYDLYRVDHNDEIERLNKELSATVREEKYAEAPKSRKKPQSKVLAEKIAALREEMDASRLTVTYRAMTPDEFEKWAGDKEASWPEQLSTQVVDPALSPDQWKALGERFGIGQVGGLYVQAKAFTQSQVVTPDLSVIASLTLRGAGSDKS